MERKLGIRTQAELEEAVTSPETTLRASTKAVFDQCADDYLCEDKHWGCDLDLIAKYLDQIPKPSVLEVGTGHAWHLANLHFFTSAKIRRAVGIDYSKAMIDRAREFLGGYDFHGKPLLEQIELLEGDICDLRLDQQSFDLALVLNNTLGNLAGVSFRDAEIQRKRALETIRGGLRNSAYLIVSVYNAAKLSEEDKYGEVFELDQDLSDLGAMDLVVRYKKTDTVYYSHWFTDGEIRHLLYEAGFRVIEVEQRQKRIVVAAQVRA